MNKNLTITATANGFALDYDETEKTIRVGNASLAADIVSDFFGVDSLYHTVRDYLDAGCELVDLEDENGTVVINALRNGCNVGEFTTNTVDADTVDLLDLFENLPNLYN